MIVTYLYESNLTSPTRPLTWEVSLPQCQRVFDHCILAGKSLATRDLPSTKKKVISVLSSRLLSFYWQHWVVDYLFVIYAVTFLLCALVTDEFRIFVQNPCSSGFIWKTAILPCLYWVCWVDQRQIVKEGFKIGKKAVENNLSTEF